MATMLEKVKAAAIRVHDKCEVSVAHGVVEVLLPEKCGLVWLATEGTMLVADADRFGGISNALRETLRDIKWGVRPA